MENDSRSSKKFWLAFSFMQLVLVIVAFVAGGIVQRYLGIFGKADFPLLAESYSLLKGNALNDLPSGNTLEYGMIKGMVQAFNDPFTSFLEPPQNELQSQTLQGKFGGIGARMERDPDGNLLIYPLPNTPASNVGLLDQDRLIKVDGLSVTKNTPLDDILAAVRGTVGTKVTLVIQRPPDFVEKTFDIIRAEFSQPSVVWNLAPTNNEVGVVQVNVIAESTPSEIQNAIEDLKKKGAKYFILDLRNNGGGLVQAGVDTAGLFLKKMVIIQEQYRNSSPKSYLSSQDGPYQDIPMVVLINHNSASAAEIITASLQANKRALVIGTTSYGKNTLQLVFQLKDGSSLHVTAAKWSVPGSDLPQTGKGIQPDIVVPDDQVNNNAKILPIAIQQLVK